jgi:hypothetical protein
MVCVSRRKRYQASEDPEEWHALNGNILDRVLIDPLDSNAAFCYGNYRGRSQEGEEEIECAEKTDERYETHQRLDDSLQTNDESHSEVRWRLPDITELLPTGATSMRCPIIVY